MGMYDELGHWDSYDDDREADPNYEYYDRVIATTNKAILYGYNQTQFWLPKSVHSRVRAPRDGEPGEVMIEGWADYTVTSIKPPKPKVARPLTTKEAQNLLRVFKD
jgi:hypothetical protein